MELDPWEQEAPSATDEMDPWEQPAMSTAPDTQEDPRVQDRVVMLPKPRPNLFAAMNDEEAKVLYDAYARHPQTVTDENGQLIHNGVPVPQTEGNTPFVDAATEMAGAVFNPGGYVVGKAKELFGAEPTLNPAETVAGPIAGGVLNAAREIPTGIAAGVGGLSKLNDRMFSAVTPDFLEPDPEIVAGKNARADAIYEGIDETLPEYNPEGMVEGGLSTVGQIGAGIFLGNKATQARAAAKLGPEVVEQLAVQVPKLTNYVGGLLARTSAGAAGTAATMGGEGNTAWFDTLDGLDENAAAAEWEKRLNIFAENFVLGAPMEMAADIGKTLGNVVYKRFLEPLHGAVDEGTKQRILMEAVMSKVALAADAKTPEEAAHWQNKILQILQDPANRKIFYEMPEGVDDVDVPLDVVSVIERGLADDPSEAASLIKRSLQQQRKEILEKGGAHVQTAGAVDRPIAATEQVLKQGRQALGGEEAVQTTQRGVQKMGQEEVGEALAAERGVSSRIEDLEAATPGIIAKDEGIGRRLAKQADESGSSTYVDRDVVSKEIAESVDTGSNIMREQKNQLYTDIKAEPTPVPDDEALTGALDKLGFQRGADVDELGIPTVADESIQPLLPKELIDELDAARDDFSTLYVDVAPKLREYAQSIIEKEGRKTQLSNDVMDLYREITERQVDVMKQTAKDLGDEALESRAMDFDSARAYYKEVYQPTARSGAVKDIGDTRARYSTDKPTSDEEVGALIKKTLTSEQPDRVKHLTQTLARPEYGETSEKVVDYALADAAEKLRTQIKTEGLTSIKTADVLNALKPYRQALNQPQFKGQLKRLDDFENNLIKHQNDIAGLEKSLEGFTLKADEVAADVYGTRMKEFFRANGTPLPKGDESLKDLFKDPQNANKISDLLKKAEEAGDPTIVKGMQAAWMKQVRDTIFTPTPGRTGDRALSATKALETIEKNNPLLEVGDKLFKGDDKVFMDALRDLMDPALEATVSKKVSALKAGEHGFSARKAMKSVNRIVLALVGPLTRLGARMSVGAGAALEYLDPNQAASRITDMMFSNPDEFLEVAKVWVKSKEPTPDNLRKAFQLLVKSGLYSEKDFPEWEKVAKQVYSEAQTSEETEEALPE